MRRVAGVSFLCLDCQKKKGGVNKVSRKKVKKKILKVTYPLLSGRMKSVFLLLPRVLLVGGASVGGLEVAGLDLLADLSLVGPFLLSAGMFVTLTFFSQPRGYLTACQYHLFFSSSHLKMADEFCFLVHANTDLEDKSQRGLAEITILSPSGGIREKP